MKKILSFFFAVLMIFLLIPVNTHAEENVSTQKVHDIILKLDQYCIKEYFGASEKWNDFIQAMKNASSYLSSGSITAEETQNQYDLLKEAYIDLMFDVFDYSFLIETCSLYFKLDKTLFSEESYNEYTKSALDIYNELISPSLYGTYSIISRQKYVKYAQKKIDEFGKDLLQKFNDLEFNLPEDYTVSQLESLIAIFEEYVTDERYCGSENWGLYSESLLYAYEITAQQDPMQRNINKAANNLIANYKLVFSDNANLTPIHDEYAEAEKLDKSLFLSTPFQKYSSAVEKLRKKEDTFIIYGYKKNSEILDFNKNLDDYIVSLAKSVSDLRADLPTTKDYNQLVSFINYYNNSTFTSDARVYGLKLIDALKDGKEVLINEESNHKDFQHASEKIKTAGETLESAEKSIIEKNASIFSSNMYMTRFLIYSIIAAFLLAFIYSRISCKIYFGKITWRQ